MLTMAVYLDPEEARAPFTDAQAKARVIRDLSDVDVAWSAVRIPKGTGEGNSTVIFQIVTPSGEVLVLQTTLNLLDALVAGCRGADEYDREREARE